MFIDIGALLTSISRMHTDIGSVLIINDRILVDIDTEHLCFSGSIIEINSFPIGKDIERDIINQGVSEFYFLSLHF